MSSIADPVTNPICITRNTNYLYVLPGTEGLISITASGADFTVTTLNTGRAAMMQVKYTAAIAGGPEYHDLAVTAGFRDGTTVSQTLNFQVYADGSGIPNVSSPSEFRIAPGGFMLFPIVIDPVSGGTVSAEDLPNWLSLSNGVVSGTAPSTGSRTIAKLNVTTGSITFKRYVVIVVGTGEEGDSGFITFPAPYTP